MRCILTNLCLAALLATLGASSTNAPFHSPNIRDLPLAQPQERVTAPLKGQNTVDGLAPDVETLEQGLQPVIDPNPDTPNTPASNNAPSLPHNPRPTAPLLSLPRSYEAQQGPSHPVKRHPGLIPPLHDPVHEPPPRPPPSYDPKDFGDGAQAGGDVAEQGGQEADPNAGLSSYSLAQSDKPTLAGGHAAEAAVETGAVGGEGGSGSGSEGGEGTTSGGERGELKRRRGLVGVGVLVAMLGMV